MEARDNPKNKENKEKKIFQKFLIIIINRIQYCGTIKITTTYKKWFNLLPGKCDL